MNNTSADAVSIHVRCPGFAAASTSWANNDEGIDKTARKTNRIEPHRFRLMTIPQRNLH